MSPGKALVPVVIIGKETKKAKPAKAAAKSTAKTAKSKAKEAEPEDDDDGESSGLGTKFIEFVVGIVGEDGSTRDLVRREIVKKSAMRKIMTEFGGLDTVLEYLIENDHLTEDDGSYFQVEG